MSGQGPDETRDTTGPIRTAYFMIRVQQCIGREPEAVNGTIERLGTGDKRQFSGERELLALLRTWPADPVKMQAAESPSKSGPARPGDD